MLKYLLPTLAILALAAWTIGMTGCADEAAPPAQTAPAGDMDAEHMEGDHDHEGHDHAADEHAGHDHAENAQPASDADSQAQATLAKLPPELQQLAEKQKICPVSGEPLGSMGVPYKVTVKGRDVLLCCQGCEGEIEENPDQYLAKLPQP